jgi:hypothetical protein
MQSWRFEKTPVFLQKKTQLLLQKFPLFFYKNNFSLFFSFFCESYSIFAILEKTTSIFFFEKNLNIA